MAKKTNQRMSNSKAWRTTLYRSYSGNMERIIEPAESIFWFYDKIYTPSIPLPDGSPVLDVGCGRGEWLLWMQRRGFDQLLGVDLSHEEAEIARSRGLCVVGEDAVSYLSSKQEQFAIIHAKDVIEHLDKNECVEFCKAACHALKPGGRLILSTFNAMAPGAATTRYGDYTHESGFTPSSMKQLLRACGFENAQVISYHACPPTLKGSLRGLAWSVVERLARFIIGLRHGRLIGPSSACHPDLLAVAAKGAEFV